jgi:hypothetical protein
MNYFGRALGTKTETWRHNPLVRQLPHVLAAVQDAEPPECRDQVVMALQMIACLPSSMTWSCAADSEYQRSDN